MSGHDEVITPEQGRGRHRGPLGKLMAAVRPEFRGDLLVFDPCDPVFGGAPCRVADCRRPARSLGMCTAHHLRWTAAGRPDLDEYVATTDARFGHAPSRCRASGCHNGVARGRLCPRHLAAWQRAGQPELDRWLKELPAAVTDPPPTCPVIGCDLWVQGSTPFCWAHGQYWKHLGRPDVDEFAHRRPGDDSLPDYERIDLRRLPPQLKLEVQYALQCRRDEQAIKTRPSTVRGIVRFLIDSQLTSLLDWPEETWRRRFPTPNGKSTAQRALVIYAHRQIKDLTYGCGWDVEYSRDVWRLRTLGINADASTHATLRFDRIPRPWLAELAKRWARWRLSSGTGPSSVYRGVAAITRFGIFLASPAVSVERLAQVDRALLERYLADLHSELAGKKVHGDHIGLLNGFFQAIRQHHWDDSLPATAMFFTEDYPKRGKSLPRALAEHVMAQVEHPDNLQRWNDPAKRLITVILIRCGLRISDAVKLPFDCLACDSDGAPYLRYYNHKMKREALVPIDEEVHRLIAEQRQRALQRWPGGVPVLFSRPKANLDGHRPVSANTYRDALYVWLEACDVRDEHERLVRLTPHQWRHTLGTRLINRDVPQEVVRRILDHDSAEMTAHYARLHDTTVRRHWEAARKVNAKGQTVTLDPDGPLAEAAWAKQRLSRATQALPNGYCGLPVQQNCPHANSCLTCPMFITTAEFLPQHRAHHQQVLQIISAAGARGHTRMAEMNRQVAGSLEKIITALEDDDDRHQESAADAS